MSLAHYCLDIVGAMDYETLAAASKMDDIIDDLLQGASLTTVSTVHDIDVHELKKTARVDLAIAQRMMTLEKHLYEYVCNKPTAAAFNIWRELQGASPTTAGNAGIKLSTFDESDFDA